MTENEIITLVMSGISLLLSGVTLYCTFFYKRTSLVGKLLDYSTQAKEDSRSMELNFSLINTGTHELLVSSINIDIINPNQEQGLIPDIESNQVPGIIKSGEVYILKFLLPILFVKTCKENNEKIKINFSVISSNGKTYTASIELNPDSMEGEKDIFFEKSCWKPLIFKADKP